MYVSYRWLERHVDLTGITPEQLADDLTLSTAEVEGLEAFAPHLADLVVGLVAEHDRHPDADKLSVCKVDVGEAEPLQIVCGAPNVGAGQKVAVATVGTVLPGDFKIKKSKIRGVESRGMICSVQELDLGDEHEGIWVLPESAEVGRPLSAALGIEDWVIEIDNKSLTHRPDLWGHRGIANEVAAIYQRSLAPLDLSLPATGDAAPYPVRVESQACSRYLALPIEGAEAAASPDWLRWLLLAVGQRPIDQIVDLSNFVMLDLGQPNHTFDAKRLDKGSRKGGIVVRDARDGESITTLDGEERKLCSDDLLICAGDEPVALAGIMGGEGSKVGEDTSQLLLEVATFVPTTIRRTSTRVGLRTDSSARFEKHLDPTLPMAAAAHYARLLQELQPEVRFPAPISDAGDWTDPAHSITLRPERVRTALGEAIPDDEIASILERLGFGVEGGVAGAVEGAGKGRGDGAELTVAIPSARATKDIGIEQDLVEEIGRIYRYGNIPEQPMQAEIRPPLRDPRRVMVRKIQDRLAGSARFHEVLSYSFLPDDMLARLGEADVPHVSVINPVDKAESRLRRSVLPSLLEGLENNRRHRADVRLFEIGKGYLPEASNERGEPKELHRVALLWAREPAGRKAAFDDNAFATLHGVVVDLLDTLGLEAPEWSASSSPPAWAHPTRCLAASWKGQLGEAAVFANLEPGLARGLGLDGDLTSDIAAAEISIDHLLEAPAAGSRYRAIPRFPGIKVDVAVEMEAATPAAELVAVIERSGKGQVVETELFDVYAGQQIGAGRKSLAYHVLLQSESKTLTDKDQAKFLTRLEKGLEGIGARLRK
ncbi:MAG: phenylalanine--tRNA ligase subunit beta [Deltaproteobacteria bacterium]|nr:phenylalanine--tRNA ligase subunit beta [Deltaproteobacteria bacterium]MBW2420460.1 phenylalanine--tRNA ligase subunit beta [Deltaproteobacteria bacterium]